MADEVIPTAVVAASVAAQDHAASLTVSTEAPTTDAMDLDEQTVAEQPAQATEVQDEIVQAPLVEPAELQATIEPVVAVIEESAPAAAPESASTAHEELKTDSPTETAAQQLIALHAPVQAEPVPQPSSVESAAQPTEPASDAMQVDEEAPAPVRQTPPTHEFAQPVVDATPLPIDLPQALVTPAEAAPAADAQVMHAPVTAESTPADVTPPTPAPANAEASTSTSPAVSTQAPSSSSNLKDAFIPNGSDPPPGPWKDAEAFKKAYREWAEACDPPFKLIVRGCATFGHGTHGKHGGYVEFACSKRHHTGGRGCPAMIRAGQRAQDGGKGMFYLRSAALVHGNHSIPAPKRARKGQTKAQPAPPPLQTRQRKKQKLMEDSDYDFDDGPNAWAKIEADKLTDSDEDYQDPVIEEPIEDDKLVHVAAKTAEKKSAESKSRAPLRPRAPEPAEDDDEPIITDSLKKFLVSLDTPKSDWCASAYATIKSNSSDNVKELLDLPEDELRQMLNACDLRPAQRVVVFNRVIAAADRFARSTKRKTRRQ